MSKLKEMLAASLWIDALTVEERRRVVGPVVGRAHGGQAAGERPRAIGRGHDDGERLHPPQPTRGNPREGLRRPGTASGHTPSQWRRAEA